MVTLPLTEFLVSIASAAFALDRVLVLLAPLKYSPWKLSSRLSVIVLSFEFVFLVVYYGCISVFSYEVAVTSRIIRRVAFPVVLLLETVLYVVFLVSFRMHYKQLSSKVSKENKQTNQIVAFQAIIHTILSTIPNIVNTIISLAKDRIFHFDRPFLEYVQLPSVTSVLLVSAFALSIFAIYYTDFGRVLFCRVHMLGDSIESHGEVNTFTLVCATIIVMVGIPGIIINTLCIVMLRILPGFKNSFGHLCTSRCISNMIFMVIYVACGGGLGYLQPRRINYFVDARAGQFLMFAYHSTMAAHIIIAVNRLMALFLPTSVHRVFNTSWLYMIIGMQWLFAAAVAIPLSFDSVPCTFAYYPSDMAFELIPSPCASIFLIFDFIVQGIECGALLLLNLCAFVGLAIRNKQLNQVSDARQKERSRKRNMRFFVQEVIHDVAFLVSFFSYAFVFPIFNKEHYWSFVFANFFWIMSFAIDSLILIVFNAEMRECLQRFFRRSQAAKVAIVVRSNMFSSRSQ
ncbi:hypothetical protein QR680_011544 [Steinernema hermaphroditum]|uniref:7TM GPCR serpentine receptor class x (Srx) domain-containing protein n=1 Tax=Steinernema hermaphroditum TaxID=289476 RepID=A0AA39LYV1_9BILA|nr:hypothetical protein QR680_011544 [Steinernema hermaphroditum]